MGFRTGAYAKIWKIEDKGNYTSVQLSTSKKDKLTGEYETDFSGIVRFIATAHAEVKKLNEGDRIKLGDCDVTNKYSKEKNTLYTNYALFSFEVPDGAPQTKVEKDPTQENKLPFDVSSDDDDKLPF